ncbi:hypothetical protein L228DRAFT_283828 [Xylona heveae TC161]|uniref:Zn(2)-C6 fungal-type domain-containing protein n=1 Tax=Xylona heveae (strain CBS 132557 / TC161) TaxID=1328760 RepID=A0A165G3G0_XYLHT|nr:hypothetical protein L228DRAFT_283828 [Xylona heveae TC161]KZF21694.1 hypothetical protein L228DRAFT_283828 [Xylona heveae TC161]
MKAGRYATSRQKACQHCSNAKAKCDRRAGRCARCANRGLPCSFLRAVPSGGSDRDMGDNSVAGLTSPVSISNLLSPSEGLLLSPGLPSPEGDLSAETDMRRSIVGSTQSMPGNSSPNYASTIFTANHVVKDLEPNTTDRESQNLETLDFSRLELLCPINVDDISNRWLHTYVPVPGQKVKAYTPATATFIYRMLKSYAALTVHGRGVPPFVHSLQMMEKSSKLPLSNCLSLVHICEKPLPGSEDVAANVLQREMTSLYEQHGTYDDMTLLGAFQAYLIYSMVLFFNLSQGSNPFLRQAMINLQDLACSSSRRGLVCTAEQQRTRPRWETWIVAEAKRRTLYVMYLFDSVLSAQDGLPTFLGTELEGLPASANKTLWRAETRREWEMAYNIHLADWLEEGLRIDELWPIPADLDEAGVLKRRSRVDLWLENVDEFGTMLYAVTCCTHGG